MTGDPLSDGTLAASLLIALAGVALWIILRPVPALLVLIGGVLLFEQFPIKVESFTVQPAFYDNFNVTLGIEALKFNPIEVVLVLLTLSVILRKSSRPGETFRIQAVSLLGAAYGGWMLFSVLWGLANHGNWKVALWIVRPVIYFLGIAFLAFQLIRTPRQVAWGVGVMAVFTFFKSLQIVARWADPGLPVDHPPLEAYGSHEDTSFALYIVWWTLCGWFLRHPRLPQIVLWSSMPAFILGILVNERRINYGTLVVGCAAIVALQRWPDLRPRMRSLVVLGAVGFLYLVVGWFGPDIGPFKPVKGFKEGIRAELLGENSDQSSWYRKVERFNLRHTVRSSPLLGTGLGVRYLQIIPLDKLSFGYAVYITHNQVVLVHSATGSIGYFLFLFFYCAVVAQLAVYWHQLQVPWHRSTALAGLLCIMNWLIVGYYDMQLFFFRNSMVAGLAIALPAVLYRCQVEAQAAASTQLEAQAR